MAAFGQNTRNRGQTIYVREDVDGDAILDTGQWITTDVGGITEGAYKDDLANGGKVTIITKDGAINPLALPASTYDALTDTPANKTGKSLDLVRVNAGETALEYIDETSDFLSQYALVAGRPAEDLTVQGGLIAGTIGPVAGQQHALPAVASDTVVLVGATQTLTGKTHRGPDGSVGAPTYSFANATNSGMRWQVASTTLDLVRSGVLKIKIGSAVDIFAGLKVTGLLEFPSSSGRIRLRGDAPATNPGLHFSTDFNSGLTSGGVGTVGLVTNQTFRVFANLAGDVGIGTTAPTSKLHVQGDTRITGDLLVDGQKLWVEGESVMLADNHLLLNKGYTNDAAQTGGLVVNFDPTTTVDTVDTGGAGFVAGVDAVSNPTVVTDGSAIFAATDIVEISGSGTNDGIFEVKSHVGTLLTVEGIGLTGTNEDFLQNQFETAAGAGAITKIAVSVSRAGVDGLWEHAFGSSTGFTFDDVALLAATQILSSKTLASPLISGGLKSSSATEIGLQVTNGALTIGSLGSVILPVKTDAGAPDDAAGGNLDGAAVVNTNEDALYLRSGGAYHKLPLEMDFWQVNAEASNPTVSGDRPAGTASTVNAVTDTVNAGLKVLRYDDTVEDIRSLGTRRIKAGVLTLDIKAFWRAQTAPPDGTKDIGWKLYWREMPDGGAVSATWAATNDGSKVLTQIDNITADTDWHESDSGAVTFASETLLADREYEFGISRILPTGGAGSKLAGDWDVRRYTMTLKG